MSNEKEEKKAKVPKATNAAKEPRGAKEPKESKGKPAAKGADAPKIAKGKPAKRTAPARLQTFYRDTVVKDLTQKFSYRSVMQVPRIEKIMDNAVADMTKIAGQKPLVTKSRKAIANFKIRQGYPVGCKVTLRGARMYDFLDRLVSVAMPRIRDFRGISGRSFDGMGNYNMGVKEQIIFPEIEYDKIDAIRGMNITISTTARTDDEARALLAAFKFPFRN
jgi:large subunit ribosomal protein L5